MSGSLLLITTGGWGAVGDMVIYWVEVIGAAKHSTKHRIASLTKNYQAPYDVNMASIIQTFVSRNNSMSKLIDNSGLEYF